MKVIRPHILLLVSILKIAFASTITRQEIQTEFLNILQWKSTTTVESFQSPWFQERISELELDRIASYVKRDEFFSNINGTHLHAVTEIQDKLMAQNSIEEILQLAEALRDHPQINPKVWIQAFISVKLLRPDMQFLKLPSLVEIMPDNFIAAEIFDQAKLARRNEECLVLDETFGADNGVENVLWYFREDLMFNVHHWYWHIYLGSRGFGDVNVREDRRGEMFSFMHHEFLARYAAERMPIRLGRVVGLNYDNVTPMVGYNPHLNDTNSRNNYTPRAPSTVFSDTRVREAEALKQLLTGDVKSGFLVETDGTLVKLDGFAGIDILADTVENSIWGLNIGRYTYDGDMNGFHSVGHFFTAMVPNPVYPGPPTGIMLTTSTSIRDPIFYQHHQAVENIFLEHKNTLEPYSLSDVDLLNNLCEGHTPKCSTVLPLQINGPPCYIMNSVNLIKCFLSRSSDIQGEFPLKWDGVSVTDFKMIAEGDGQVEANFLKTFWNYKEFNFTRGLDYQHNHTSPPVSICSKHLDHVEFDYELTVERLQSATGTNGTVRIYMAKRYDEILNTFTMEEQRKLFFTLDQFPISLQPGVNKITRNSRDSSLTIPFEAWLDLEPSDQDFQNCGCGFPHHLLLPKGSSPFTTFDVFVIITPGNIESEFYNPEEGCPVAPIWCGLRDKKYPSLYPMGYPFDRRPYTVGSRPVANLEEFVAGIPNSKATQVRIQHV